MFALALKAKQLLTFVCGNSSHPSLSQKQISRASATNSEAGAPDALFRFPIKHLHGK